MVGADLGAPWETMKQGIELDSITRIVDGEAHLSEVRLSLAPGSFTVLLGRTRAGKTSLLRLLAGLDPPTRGRILAGGADVTRVDVRRRDVAMVYQQFVNYPSLTVYENIASPLRLRKTLDDRTIDQRVRETAAMLHIEGLLGRLPAELSGGQQQRTAIARALAKDAGLLLLDEPLANLDYKLREELRAELRALFQGRSSSIVVYATTEPSEALLLGGQTAVLDEGRLLQIGPALDVYGAPASEHVGRIFSDPQMNLLDLEVTAAGEARLSEHIHFPLSGSLRALTPGPYRLGIRPNHVRLAPSSEADLRLPAIVLLEEINGSETLIHASSGPLSITAQLPGIHRHPLGAKLDLFVAPGRLFVWGPEGRLIASPPLARSSSPAPDAAPLSSPPLSSPAAHGTH